MSVQLLARHQSTKRNFRILREMDQNNDDHPKRSFSTEEVSKLPEDSGNELFDEIDPNKGVLQYGEFKIMAQITKLTSQHNKNDSTPFIGLNSMWVIEGHE